jgi:hypothetical protein
MRRAGLLVFAVLLVLGACAPAAQSPTPLPPAATAAPTSTAVSATSLPSTVAPSPTEAPTTAASVDNPTPLPTPPITGAAHFRDKLATADLFTLELRNVPASSEGEAYQAWLLSDDGTAASLGALTVNPDGSVSLEWNSPTGENLLSRYSRVQVTLEPAAGSAAPAGKVVVAGELKDAALANARRLFVRNSGEPPTPRNTALALGLVAQSSIAIQHVQNAVNAAAIGSLPEMRMHLEHVINILEGAAGPRFGDYDGNRVAENPGDGFGVMGYAAQIADLLQGHAAVANAAADVKAQTASIQDRSLQVLRLEDRAAITAQLAELKALADRFGANQIAGLYQAAQDAVGFPISAVQ